MNVINEIKKAYTIISNEIAFKMIDQKLRDEIKSMLNILLRNKCSGIKCDLENNPPEVIDRREIVARIYFKRNFKDRYIDLIFGREDFDIIEKDKLNIPTYDPQTGELNPYYEELTGNKNPLKTSSDIDLDQICKDIILEIQFKEKLEDVRLSELADVVKNIIENKILKVK